jgi:hypothetical protein
MQMWGAAYALNEEPNEKVANDYNKTKAVDERLAE